MARDILVFYGSYRRGRQGIKLARWIVEAVQARGDDAELIDAKIIDLPMLDRRFSDYPRGEAPPAMAELAARIHELLDVFGCTQEVYELGLGGKVMRPVSEQAIERIIAARRVVAAELARIRQGDLIEPFVLDRYNRNAPIIENLIFGTRTTMRFDSATLLFELYA